MGGRDFGSRGAEGAPGKPWVPRDRGHESHRQQREGDPGAKVRPDPRPQELPDDCVGLCEEVRGAVCGAADCLPMVRFLLLPEDEREFLTWAQHEHGLESSAVTGTETRLARIERLSELPAELPGARIAAPRPQRLTSSCYADQSGQ